MLVAKCLAAGVKQVKLSWQQTTTNLTNTIYSSSSSVGRVPRRATILPMRPLAVVNRLIGLLPSVISVDFIPSACSIFTSQSKFTHDCRYDMAIIMCIPILSTARAKK